MGSGGRRVGLALDVILQLSDFWATEQHNRVWSWANLNTLTMKENYFVLFFPAVLFDPQHATSAM